MNVRSWKILLITNVLRLVSMIFTISFLLVLQKKALFGDVLNLISELDKQTYNFSSKIIMNSLIIMNKIYKIWPPKLYRKVFVVLLLYSNTAPSIKINFPVL